MTGRLIAVGDIHGCHIEFAEMLDLLELDEATTALCSSATW